MDFNFIFAYLKEQLAGLWTERTTWDGAVLIGVGVAYLVLAPLAQWAAYIAIAYGAWTLLKREINK
jgi:hypothetical protein